MMFDNFSLNARHSRARLENEAFSSQKVMCTCLNDFLIGCCVCWEQLVVDSMNNGHRVGTPKVFEGALGVKRKS